MSLIVMGVSGCGKTSLGTALAERLGLPFIEGDSLHPPQNIERMRAGIALEDIHRWPWLDAVGAELRTKRPAVASCSALRRSYRDRIRVAAGREVRFVCLNPAREVIERRLADRKGHFMPASLLSSQLATLELPDGEDECLILSGSEALDLGVEMVLRWLEPKGEGL